jgi:hypothetical protein
MAEQHPIATPPSHLLKKFSAQAQDEAKKRNGAGYLKTFATLCIEWAMNSKTTPNDRQIRSSEIEPSFALVEQWHMEATGGFRTSDIYIQDIDTQAARWGYEQRGAVNESELQKARDEELDACCEWLTTKAMTKPWETVPRPVLVTALVLELRDARRLKPPSLKEQAYNALDTYIYGEPDPNDKERTYNTIRRALKSLPD